MAIKMAFELVKGSGNRAMSTVYLDSSNCSVGVWFCEGQQEWHWQLIWEDGGPGGTHVHSGTAPTRYKARADIARAMQWTEETWPRYEYFENNW